MPAPRRLAVALITIAAAVTLAGCGPFGEKEKAEPLPMPSDPAVAVRPCDEDAASRVVEVYQLFGRLPSPMSDRPSATRRTDPRWGPTVVCVVPVRPGASRPGTSTDPVTFTIFSSPKFERWYTGPHLAEIGAKLQIEYGQAEGERILIAAKGDKAVEAVWVADDGLVISVQSPNAPLSVTEQRALLLAVAGDIHETYAEPENLPAPAPPRSPTTSP